MNKLMLYPYELNDRDLLTIRHEIGIFPAGDYRIESENGKIIRKGHIQHGLDELKLRIVGFRRGVYTFLLGTERIKFVVQ